MPYGEAISYFAQYKISMRCAQGLALGNIVQFRMCKAAAHLRGFEPKDIHGFVTVMSMAEAEITRLRQENYAYLR